jgi:addiction module HigA family antidote
MLHPPHPGRILRRCFSTGAQADAASAQGITYPQLVSVYQGRTDITPELSAKLDRIFFKKSDGFFLRMQEQYDDWK